MQFEKISMVDDVEYAMWNFAKSIGRETIDRRKCIIKQHILYNQARVKR